MRILIIAVALLALNGCDKINDTLGIGSGYEAPLKGERISILELEKSLTPGTAELEKPVEIPPAWHNHFWPQTGGYPNHSMQHLLFNEGQLGRRKWRSHAGSGAYGLRLPNAQPIVVDGLLYTLNTRSIVRALETETGHIKWQTFVGQKGEDDGRMLTGGIAFNDSRLYVTNGLNEVLALQPKTGEILWRAKIATPSQAAPTVLNGRVFITTIDNRLIALDETDGSQLWEFTSTIEGTGVLGTASPAVNRDIVVPVFSNGDIVALRVENGSVAWGDTLSAAQRFGGFSSITDIQALPVIDKGLLISMNVSGRIAAMDVRTGKRVWQRNIGGSNTPWVAGDVIYVISDDNNLIALNRLNGLIHWVKPLRAHRRDNDKDPVYWKGPVLAGGRLFMASSDGKVVEANAITGELREEWHDNAEAGFYTEPVIADRTLYLIDSEGTLYAFE